MNRPVVMVDIDGVLADFVLGFTVLLHHRFNAPIVRTPDQPVWGGFPGVSEVDERVGWEHIRASTTFWRTLPRLATHDEALRLRALQYRTTLVFATARTGNAVVAQTQGWLDEQFGIEKATVLVSARKGELAHALHARYVIDDCIGNAVYAANHCKDLGTEVYLLDRLYNQFDHTASGSPVTRIKTLSQFLDVVERGCAV